MSVSPISLSTAHGEVVRFGVFEANLRQGELRKNGVKVKIQDLPFRALGVLVSRPNDVVSREQLRRALWPEDVFVDFDRGISSAINRLRESLGDSADNPIFVETVERRGYRWIAPLYFSSPAPETISPDAAAGPLSAEAPSAPVSAAAKLSTYPVSDRSWTWLLGVPALALVLAAWGFWPLRHSITAAGSKPGAPPASTPGLHVSTSEAQQFYLKGTFYWEKRSPDSLNKALDAFTQAIVHDPNYAPAYVGLANCYNLMREYTAMPASEAYPRALAAARRAVELDDRSSEAHAALAFALFWGSWDATAADHEFRRSLELNPNNALAHHWFATYLSAIGRHKDALEEIERAQTLDPASKSILADKGDLLWWAGHHEESTTLLQQLEAADPDFVSPHRYLKITALAVGDYRTFLAEWKLEAPLLEDESSIKVLRAAEMGYAAGGARKMFESIRAEQERQYQQGSYSPYLLAETEAWLGSKQEALQHLKIAFEKHDEYLVQMAGNPAFTNLHDEPEYKDLVSKLGFPSNK